MLSIRWRGMLTRYLHNYYCTSGELLCFMSAVGSDVCSSEDLKRDNISTADKRSSYTKSYKIDTLSHSCQHCKQNHISPSITTLSTLVPMLRNCWQKCVFPFPLFPIKKFKSFLFL